MAVKKNYKLNLFELLDSISLKNVGYFDNLSEDQKKEFSPLVIMRWLTGCNNSRSNPARQIYFINEFVNPYVFSLRNKIYKHDHSKLLYDLMTITTIGKKFNYKFIKKQNKRGSKYPKATAVVKQIFQYSSRDAQEAVNILKKEEIISMALSIGCQDNEIKDIKKELKNKHS